MDIVWILGFILAIFSSTVFSQANDFTAAVFEHRYRHDLEVQTPEEVIRSNLQHYKLAVKLAAEKGADILVFNEYGLFPNQLDRALLRPYLEHIPDPNIHHHNPCAEKELFKDRHILSTLSCLARDSQIYIVANMGDIQPCDIESQTCDADKMGNCPTSRKKCSEDGVLMYNTDVAFDSGGYIVARYHKMHPYFELFNTPDETEFVTFKTSFGTFGLIICFDSIFKESVDLVEKYGVDTMIFSTFWYDDIAPLNAPEFQQSWALANRVNFLASNGHTPGNSTLGSGIYSKDKGALVYTYEPDGESKLLVAKLSSDNPSSAGIFVVKDNGVFPKLETGNKFPLYCYDKLVGPPIDMNRDLGCYKSQTENHKLVRLDELQGQVQACDNGFCCSLVYHAEDMKESYYLAVRNFTNDVEGFYHWSEETCLLVRCDPFEGKECVLWPSTSRTVFKSIEMRAQFTANRVYATVSKSKNRLAPKSEWTHDSSSKISVLKFKSDSKDPLLKVGLFGRCYERDPPFTPWY